MWGAFLWGEPQFGDSPEYPAIIYVASYIYVAIVEGEDRVAVVRDDDRVAVVPDDARAVPVLRA